MLIENPKVVLERFQKRLDEIQNAPQNVAGEDNSDWNESSTLTLLFIKQELERSVRLLEEGECPDWLKPKAKKVKWEAPFDGLTCGDLLERLKPADPDLPVYLSADGTYSDELFHCRSITYYPGNQYARTVLRMYTPGGLMREPPFLRHKKGKAI